MEVEKFKSARKLRSMIDHVKFHSPVNIDITFPFGVGEAKNSGDHDAEYPTEVPLDHEIIGAVLDRCYDKALLAKKGTCEGSLELKVVVDGKQIKESYSTLPCQLSKEHAGKHAYTRPTQTVLSWESHE